MKDQAMLGTSSKVALCLVVTILSGCRANPKEIKTSELVVPAQGGTLTITAAQVVLPPGSVSPLAKVTVSARPKDFSAGGLDDIAFLHDIAQTSTEHVDVVVEGQQPASPINVRLKVPSALRAGVAKALYLNEAPSGLVTVETLAGQRKGDELVLEVPRNAFRNDGPERTIASLLLATELPRTERVAYAAILQNTRSPIRLGPPLVANYRTTSGYGLPTIDGKEKMHWGVDYAPFRTGPVNYGGQPKPGSTNVISMADGKVISTGFQIKDGKGWGRHVLIAHGPGGSRPWSVYAHLEDGSVTVKPGDTVSRGQPLATMGNTGTNAQHLHVEYIPAGPSVNDGNKIDPETQRYFATLNTFVADSVVSGGFRQFVHEFGDSDDSKALGNAIDDHKWNITSTASGSKTWENGGTASGRGNAANEGEVIVADEQLAITGKLNLSASTSNQGQAPPAHANASASTTCDFQSSKPTKYKLTVERIGIVDGAIYAQLAGPEGNVSDRLNGRIPLGGLPGQQQEVFEGTLEKRGPHEIKVRASGPGSYRFTFELHQIGS